MDKTASHTTIFAAKDAERFSKQYREKANSLEAALLKNDFSAFITNLRANRIIIANNQTAVFATINDKEYGNTHICSPYSLYITYAKSYADHFDNLWFKILIIAFTSFFGKLFKWMKINKVIQINNTLATINLHSNDMAPLISDLTKKLVSHYPKHAVMLPRFNQLTDPNLFSALKENHFIFIPTKTTHIYDPRNHYMKKNNPKQDLALLKKRNYQIVSHDELSNKDMNRIHELYQMLFIEKHSHNSPDLTVHYFQQCQPNRWFEFIALRNETGIIDAFISHARMNDVIVCGPLGYDTHKPRNLGLYRMIMSLSLNNAYEKGCIYNLGSGNEQFKMNRGSIREIEYNAVYCQHLPFYRRIPWVILSWCTNRFSLPLFKKYLI